MQKITQYISFMSSGRKFSLKNKENEEEKAAVERD
jgi:hypothetical protein